MALSPHHTQGAVALAPPPTPVPSRLTADTCVLIAESIPHMAWTAAPNGGITYLNERGWSYLGGDKECPAGLWASRIHPEDVDAVRTAWGTSIAHEEEFDLKYRIRRFDGDFRWHSSRAIPMRDRNGVSYAWIGIATEIEDKKQMELALRRSEREATEAATLLRSIEAAAPIGLKLVDPEFRIVAPTGCWPRSMASRSGRCWDAQCPSRTRISGRRSGRSIGTRWPVKRSATSTSRRRTE